MEQAEVDVEMADPMPQGSQLNSPTFNLNENTNGNTNGSNANANGVGSTNVSPAPPPSASIQQSSPAATSALSPTQGPAPPSTSASVPESTSTASGPPPAPTVPVVPQAVTQSQPQPQYYNQQQSPPQPPSQVQMQNRYRVQPVLPQGKVAIVDPPKSARRAGSQGFASPTREYGRENSKFNEDVSRLTHAVQQSVPEAARRVVRDHWEKTLLGSEFHQAFVMNAVVHHADGVILRRAIRDFGHKMVSESKAELIGQFRTRDLDDVATAILNKASDSFLDKALEKRLETIDARSLINALARAERLGYEGNDVLNGETNGAGSAQPQVQQAAIQYASQPQQQSASQPAPAQYARQPVEQRASPPQAGRAPQIQSLQCPLCWRKFASAAPYEYHVKKQLCTKSPPNASGFPFSCQHCGAGFITQVGQQYHLANKVCGDHGTAPATPKAPAPTGPGSPITISSGINSPALPPAQPAAVLSSTYPTPSVPQHTASPYASSPAGTPASSTPRSDDPYSHLTPATLERMKQDLRLAEEQYAPRFREAETIADPTERKNRLDGLQNSFSTKQSIIRKKYGVRLRQRRTKAEIDAERMRISQYSPASSNKRQRVDNGADGTPTYVNSQQQQVPPQPPVDTASKHLSVSDMNSAGLGGSSATAALTDPTAQITQNNGTPSRPAPPRKSMSSYQRSGYRVDTHGSRSAQQSPDPVSAGSRTTAADPGTKTQSVRGRRGSASAPMVIDDESGSENTDSDSDAEIPATLPPGRKNVTPSKSMVG